VPAAAGRSDAREELVWVGPPADVTLDESALAGLGSGTRGLFITFEGLDGCGKSTQMALLADALTAAGYDVLATREPGGTALGEALRSVLLDVGYTGMSPRAEALLYAAARAQLVEEVVRPALNEGRVVLCDRYIDSSLAYQGYGRGLVIEDVITLNVWATECLFPDLTVALLVNEDVRVVRAGADTADRLESEESAFFHRVAEGYRRLAEDHPHRIRVIDGAGAVEDVHGCVKAVVEEEFGLFSAPDPTG
jgi:dTMP kinase